MNTKGKSKCGVRVKIWNRPKNNGRLFLTTFSPAFPRKKKKKDNWAKPDKPLSDKQKKRKERREKDYKGALDSKKEFSAHFYLHDQDINPEKYIGEKGEVLNPLRTECKSYIDFNRTQRCFTASGDSLDMVEEAILRVRNLYLKVIASRTIPIEKGKTKGWIYHMIEPPEKPSEIKIARPPKDFEKPHDVLGDNYRIFEAVHNGDDMIAKYDESEAKEISKGNFKKIGQALGHALGVIHLFDEEIKMRIKFGHVCAINYPTKRELWPLGRLNNEVLGRMQSKFATCLATENAQLDSVFGKFSEKDQKRISREFKIFAIRHNDNIKWECAFDVEFRRDNFLGSKNTKVKKGEDEEHENDDKIGYWNATTDRRNVMEINMMCPD